MSIVLIRAVILYVVIAFSLRLMGKRQLGELQPSELVVTILISNIASIPVEDSSVPMLLGLVPILTLVCVDIIVSACIMKFTKFRKFVIGSPRVIISNGKILQKEMKRLRYTIDDLTEAMRNQQIFDITQVNYAIIETTGKINFMLKRDFENAQRQDVSCGGSSSDPQTVIIRDGVADHDKLRSMNLQPVWLDKTLADNKVKRDNVFIMTADVNGNYTLIRKDDES